MTRARSSKTVTWFACLIIFVGVVKVAAVQDYENPFQNANLGGQRLSTEDLFFMFGRKDHIPPYEIKSLNPVDTQQQRWRRWNNMGGATIDGLQNSVKVNLTLLGAELLLELWPNRHLVSSSGMTAVKRIRNSTVPIIIHDDLHDSSCFYHGRVRSIATPPHGSERYSANDGIAALDLCQGYSGIVATSRDHYVIRPMPSPLKAGSTSSGSAFADEVISGLRENQPHLIYRHNVVTAESENGIDHSFFDIRDRSRITTSPSPGETSRSGLGSGRKRKRASSTANESRKHGTGSGSGLAVETAVFIDRDLYDSLSRIYPSDSDSQAVRVILTMINAVQVLFHHESLGYRLDLPITRLEILTNDVEGLERPRDIDKFLSNFCMWQKKMNGMENSNDDLPRSWDHAVLLTGLDLHTFKGDLPDDRVVGLAPVAGMCTASRSCTVNEGRNFEAVYVVAHEIGHSLGMRHDGAPNNNCDSETYLMSSTLGGGKTSWSRCSRNYFHDFIKSDQSECLKVVQGISQTESIRQSNAISDELPGHVFDADQQCKMRFGADSKRSPLQPIEDACHDLICQTGTKEEYVHAHPALEGTTCGRQKWCRGGRCVLKKDPKTEGHWGSWSPYSGCASGCLRSEEDDPLDAMRGLQISQRLCTDSRSPSPCKGRSQRYRLCDVHLVCASARRRTIVDYAALACKQAADKDSSLTGKTTPLTDTLADPWSLCHVQCAHVNGSSEILSTSAFPDGTQCDRDAKGKHFFCVQGRCTDFLCDKEGCVDSTTGESFERWRHMSICYPSCITGGKGVQVVRSTNECGAGVAQTDCDNRNAVQLCDMVKDACPRGVRTTRQFAAEVCKLQAETVPQLSSWGLQLPSVSDDPHRGCVVSCRDGRQTHRYYKLDVDSSGWFPAGTYCGIRAGENSYCVQGKCMEFNDEDILQDNAT